MKIAIYGVGLEGEKFYCRYKKVYEITFAIDKNCNRTFHGIPVYSIEQLESFLKNNNTGGGIPYIVITTGIHYLEIKSELESIGLEVNKDFCKMECLLEKKKAILYGNCHIDVLRRYLESNPCFNKIYTCNYYFVHDKARKQELYPSDTELADCDLLIAQDIRDNNSVGAASYNFLTKKVTSKCICVKVPNTYGLNLYFPQISIADWAEIENRHIGKAYVDLENRRDAHYVGEVIRGIIGHRDLIIEEMIKNGCIPSIMKEEINNNVYWKKELIIEYCNNALSKFEKREQDCDIRISDYIKENYKKKRLFYDPYHPVSELIFEKGRRILNFLNIQIDENIVPCYELDQNEIFIYGCVQNSLKLKFENKYIRRFYCNYTLRNRAITLEEYLEDYAAWIS